MANPIWGFLWFIVLIFFSFFVAWIGCFFYVWTYLFSQCCDCCTGIADFFLKCVQFPGYCAKSMIDCKKMC
ncbi:hypothetical protein ACLKA6_015095 [Drosophila palustris]